MKSKNCVSCGKENLYKDEIAITRKLVGEDTTEFYCLNCLAAYLDVTGEDILDKIKEFKKQGCKLF